MNVVRFDPFRELDRLSEQAWGRSRVPAVPMDAYRRPDELVLEFDLPGFEPTSIDVTVERGLLTVTGERVARGHDDATALAAERPRGRFTRRLRLGDGLDVERVGAGYDAGVLTVRIPVTSEVRPRHVEVRAGPSGSGDAAARSLPGDGAQTPADPSPAGDAAAA